MSSYSLNLGVDVVILDLSSSEITKYLLNVGDIYSESLKYLLN